MLNGKKILVIVPARGGSKGIKLKNIQPLNGIPLVGLVGIVVGNLPYIDRAIVSTDHPEIARVALKYGLDVPFFRPEEISQDTISDWDVLHHALRETEKIDSTSYDIIVMLQPTSPLRKPGHVTKTVEKLIKENLDSVWTVSETDSKYHPLKQLILKDDLLDYYAPAAEKIIARQQLTPVYHRNGAAYAISRDCLVNQMSIKGKNSAAVIIEDFTVDIDNQFDLMLASFILEKFSRES